MNIKYSKQKGFSLLEILVALGLMMVLIAATQPVVGRLVDFRANVITDTNINILGDAVSEWYEENAWDFGQIESSTIPLPNGGSITNNSGTFGAGWERLALRYGGSANYINDGYNHHYRVFISDQLEQEYRGVIVPYHVIALVSSGGISQTISGNVVSSVNTTFNQSTGEINIAPTESAYVINGFPIQKKMVDISIERTNRIARAYENFYSLQFAKEREPAINYFGRLGASVRWDITSPVEALCTASGDNINGFFMLGHDINNFGLLEAIGFSSEAAKSGWGENIRLLNCDETSGVRVLGNTRTFRARTPNSPSGNNIPPYSAILGFHLPNGETYTTTVTSSF